MDISKVSDEELLKMLQAPEKSGADVSAMSDEELIKALKSEKPGVVEDVAKTVPAGLARGAAGVFGLPGFIQDGADYLLAQTAGRVDNYVRNGDWSAPKVEDIKTRSAATEHPLGFKMRGVGDVMTYNNAISGIEKVAGPLYKPQTTAGEYANTIAEFAPAALTGGGSLLQRGAQVAIPAITSETAGQVTRQVAPEYEGAARLIGAVGGGVGTSLAQAPRGTNAIVREAMGGVDDAAIAQARQLMDDAAAQGVRLTWPEAVQQVTRGGTRLGDLQRVVENSPGGSTVMREFMAERPQQIQQAGNAAIGQISDVALDPVHTGMRTQQAAQQTIADTQAGINAMTRGAYQAAEATRVPPAQFAALMGDDLFAQTLQAVRGNPALNRGIAALPDDSVGTIDMVQRIMREQADNLRLPGQANTSNTAAAAYQDARQPAIRAAEAATGGATGPYATARNVQQQLRHDRLEPMNRGPIGDISRREGILEQAEALLPNKPAAGSQRSVYTAVRQLSRRDADAAQNLVRTYAQSVFDESIQNLQSGASQFGGAKFAAVISGNPQQARNLQQAIIALPQGGIRWQAFRRFLDIAEATGQRQQVGSQTAFNESIKQQLKGGGIGREIGRAAATGGATAPALPGKLSAWFDELRLGRNTEQLARLFTDPGSERLLRQLANAPAGSARAQATALQLIALSERASNSGSLAAQPVP